MLCMVLGVLIGRYLPGIPACLSRFEYARVSIPMAVLIWLLIGLFFFVVFKAFITPELATEYLAGVVLLGAAPCTAMVFVWSTLTKGDPASPAATATTSAF